ncbi:MAG TPA: dihydrodipicolinate reductase C-terminal domain-containing protein [Bryobacteraceae bacterium]|nr:dihydrodipicolinate reductase C-terminal domain-containing protein [Bryobacteraceae bacterium]
MKIAIVGYGKMGRLIEQLAPEYGCEVALKLDEFNNAGYAGITVPNFAGIDAAIEFSTPEAAIDNIERISALGVNLVVGTTGWLKHLERARTAVERAGTGLVWAPNFSIGVNVFQRMVAEAARLMASEKDYEAWAWEIHHSAKKDAPSGTLLSLVDTMRKTGYEARIDTSASRAGRHPGTHEIGFDSAADTITLRHTARSREGLARGALKAAQWIEGKSGFFEFSQVLFGK